jgi:pimeloyl-ACP methyl ester carboxylesterase
MVGHCFGGWTVANCALRHPERVRAQRGAVLVAVDAIEKRWSDDGAGLWELGRQRWTHSRLVCAAGVARGGRGGRGAAPCRDLKRAGRPDRGDTAADALHAVGSSAVAAPERRLPGHESARLVGGSR